MRRSCNYLFNVNWHKTVVISVADPGCLFRIRDPDFLPIPDPGSKNLNKREGWNKSFCQTFFCSYKFHKIVNYFIFEMPKKKIWANFLRIIELFTQKLSLSSQKYGFGIGDPRSGIRKKPIHYPGSRSQKGTGSWIRIRNTGSNRCRTIHGYRSR